MKTYRSTVIADLAEAISSYNISGVADLLSETGNFAIQNDSDEIVFSGKEKFIEWLNGCFADTISRNNSHRRLNFTIVQCLHCVTGNPVIIFENGKFPSFNGNSFPEGSSGLVITSADNKVTGIELCSLVIKTENPFIYEKRCIKHGMC